MAELKAPTGAFLILELEPDVTPELVTAIFHIAVRLPGVAAACDLSLMSIDTLNERVLMRLSSDEQKLLAPPAPRKKK